MIALETLLRKLPLELQDVIVQFVGPSGTFLNSLISDHEPGQCHCTKNNFREPFDEPFPYLSRFKKDFLEDSRYLFEKSKLRYLQELWLCLKGFISTNFIYYDVRYLESTLAEQLLKLNHDFIHVHFSILGTDRCTPECLAHQGCSKFTKKIRATKKHNVPWLYAKILSEDASLLHFCYDISSLAIHCNKMDFDRLKEQITSSPCWTSLTFLECNFTGIGKNLFELKLPSLKAFFGTWNHDYDLDDKFLSFTLHMPRLIFLKLDGFDCIALWTSPSLKHIHLRYTRKLVILGSAIVYPKVVTSHQYATYGSTKRFELTITGCISFTKAKFLATNVKVDLHNSIWEHLEVAILSDEAYNTFIPQLNNMKRQNNKLLLGLRPRNFAGMPPTLKTYFPNSTIYRNKSDCDKKWRDLLSKWISELDDPFFSFNNNKCFTCLRKSFLKHRKYRTSISR